MAQWTSGNKALTADTVVALAAKGEMWRQVTFMLYGTGSGYCVLVGSDGAGTDNGRASAATRKGVTIYHTGDATAENPYGALKKHYVEGPVDLSKLAGVASAANQVLHWFGHKLGAE